MYLPSSNKTGITEHSIAFSYTSFGCIDITNDSQRMLGDMKDLVQKYG
jgi:hypothetical protein